MNNTNKYPGSKSGSSTLEPKKPFFTEMVESIVIAVLLAVLIRFFILAPFWIPSGSMEPTLQVDDRIIVSKLAYRFWEPKRLDIIVFKYPKDPSKDYVKRLIGLGSETVALKNNKLYINGQEMTEEYLPSGLRYNDFGPVVVPKGEYLMLGDNRPNSEDSRFWGPLQSKYIIGKALFIYWPLNRIRVLN